MAVITHEYEAEGPLFEDCEVVFYHHDHTDAMLGPGEKNARIPIPFKGKLIGADIFITEACTHTDVDLEKNAAAGTLLFSFDISPDTSSATVGQKIAGTKATTYTNQVAIIDNDFINVEVSTSDIGLAGSFNLYLYFDTGHGIEI